jgi:hypothetical protein
MFFGCLGTGLHSIQWFLKKFLTCFALGGHNFLNSIPFLMIFNVLNAPIGGVQILLEH